MKELFVTAAVVGAGMLAGAITLWTIGEFAAKAFNFMKYKFVGAWASAKLRKIKRLDREYMRKGKA